MSSNEEQNKMPESLELEDFSIEELEDRLELLLFSDNNCKCPGKAGN